SPRRRLYRLIMFLKNAWYCAIWAKDLLDQPIGRTIAGEEVVLFRGAGGKAAALEDRCCHRAAPLSRGRLVSEGLQCGYHGLKFDTDGRCLAVPSQTSVPPGARVRAYPVRERWNVVWIWMGDPDLADEAKITRLPWLADSGWTVTPGYLHLEGNGQLLIDNLLDFSHVSYLHPNTLAGDPREAATPVRTERSEEGLRVGRWMIDFDPPPLFAAAGGLDGRCDRWQFANWRPPSLVFMDVGLAPTGSGAPEGDRSKGISIWSTHMITPETETSCHYHFGFARNFGLEDDGLSKLLFDGAVQTFLEDKAMIEAQQRKLSGGALDGLVDINADAAQLLARRMLADLLRQETAA
ncbi:MAG TPA: aromatic ring-hydroxylating dioxygenase subunit alpha, partial [Stellaceae bacterium]|nr:aromatic ring-hydroxylating dioxygenase subunit alpha [Stellaceae bacterium]